MPMPVAMAVPVPIPIMIMIMIMIMMIVIIIFRVRSPSLGACNYPILLLRRFHRPIYFSLNLSRIQIPTGTSVTSCNHKHGLMLTCRNDVDMFTWGCFVLSFPKHAHVDWNWPILREEFLKIDWSAKKAVALAYCRSCRLLVMGSCPSIRFFQILHLISCW